MNEGRQAIGKENGTIGPLLQFVLFLEVVVHRDPSGRMLAFIFHGQNCQATKSSKSVRGEDAIGSAKDNVRRPCGSIKTFRLPYFLFLYVEMAKPCTSKSSSTMHRSKSSSRSCANWYAVSFVTPHKLLVASRHLPQSCIVHEINRRNQ